MSTSYGFKITDTDGNHWTEYVDAPHMVTAVAELKTRLPVAFTECEITAYVELDPQALETCRVMLSNPQYTPPADLLAPTSEG